MSAPKTAAAAAWNARLGDLGFGSASLGNLFQAMDDGAAVQTVQAAFGEGIRFVDSAPHYGLGLAEERLGLALRALPRQSVVISSKVGRLLEPTAGAPASAAAVGTAWAADTGGTRDDQGFDVPAYRRRVPDLSEAGIRASIEASCARLGTGHLDIALLHDPEELVADDSWLAALDVLTALRSQGLVSAVGVGSKHAPTLIKAVQHTDLDVVMEAGRFTLLDTGGRELLDTCAQRGVAVIAVGVYNSGILATDTPTADAKFEYAQAPADLIDRAAAIAGVCATHGVSLPAAAAQFPFTHPAVANVTLGMATPEQVRSGAERIAAQIPGQLWRDLSDAGLVDFGSESPE